MESTLVESLSGSSTYMAIATHRPRWSFIHCSASWRVSWRSIDDPHLVCRHGRDPYAAAYLSGNQHVRVGPSSSSGTFTTLRAPVFRIDARTRGAQRLTVKTTANRR